jgi:hypothetical protein
VAAIAVLHFKKWNFLRAPEHSGGANDHTWRTLVRGMSLTVTEPERHKVGNSQEIHPVRRPLLSAIRMTK